MTNSYVETLEQRNTELEQALEEALAKAEDEESKREKQYQLILHFLSAVGNNVKFYNNDDVNSSDKLVDLMEEQLRQRILEPSLTPLIRQRVEVSILRHMFTKAYTNDRYQKEL